MRGHVCCLWLGLIVGLSACNSTWPTPPSLPPHTPRVLPTVTPRPSATNTATPLPPTLTSTPQLFEIDPVTAWQFMGAHALPPAACAAEGVILGGEAATCAVSASGGSAIGEITVSQPPQVITLHIACAGTANCADDVDAQADGLLSVEIDNQVVWRATCPAGQCDRAALGASPAISFVAREPRRYRIQLSVAPRTRWPIASVQVEAHPIPQLIQGVAYSPFRDCQNPNWGPFPSEAEMRADLQLMQHVGNAIRTYSTTGGQDKIPQLARDVGLRVTAGAWLGRDHQKNEEEIAALIELANRVEVESVIVGNEVLLRGDLSEDELLAYIRRVKRAVKVPVTTAEIGGILQGYPRLMEAVDYYLVHLYPFWDGVPIENASRYVADQYHEWQQRAPQKRVVIGETGWPSGGPINGQAEPSLINQRRYAREFLSLAQRENIEFYYFAAIDELWKTEGGVGRYWGLLDSERRNKFDVQSVLTPLTETITATGKSTSSIVTATPGVQVAQGVVFPIFTDYAAADNHYTPSGWMGALSAIRFNDCARVNGQWDKRMIELGYAPSPTDTVKWAGIYWLAPDSNWGTQIGGYDLSAYTRLRFRARSDLNGARVKFMIGGVYTGTYPSSLSKPIFAQEADRAGFVTLSTEWREFHIDLSKATRTTVPPQNLSYVIDGFGWVADRAHTPNGVKVYLQEIVFDQPTP